LGLEEENDVLLPNKIFPTIMNVSYRYWCDARGLYPGDAHLELEAKRSVKEWRSGTPSQSQVPGMLIILLFRISLFAIGLHRHVSLISIR